MKSPVLGARGGIAVSIYEEDKGEFFTRSLKWQPILPAVGEFLLITVPFARCYHMARGASRSAHLPNNGN